MRMLVLAATAIMAAGPGFGATVPHIKNIVLAPQGDGTFNATINGSHFGSTPAGIPCTACSPQQIEVGMLGANDLLSLNVTGWTGNSITLTGISAQPGDALRFAVWNALLGNAAAAGKVASSQKGLPRITSVATSGSGANVTITISGSGFGAAPAQVGQTTTSPFFVFTDYNAQAPGSGSGGSGGYPWNAGFCGANECDGVTIGYVSWADTQIVVSAFGGSYGSGVWYDNPGDAFCVAVWPSTSQSNGTTGGNLKCGRLPD